MPVVPVCLDIDDKTYEALKSDTVELCGLVKNVDTKK